MSKRLVRVIVGIISLGAVVGVLFYTKQKRVSVLEKAQSVENLPTMVSVEIAKPVAEGRRLEIVGTTEGISDVMVISETQGKITAVHTRVGKYVTRGSTLLEVDDELSRIALATAEVNYDKAKKDFSRYEGLFKERSISETQYEAFKLALAKSEMDYSLAKRRQEDTKVKSPISGFVTMFNLEQGEMLGTGSVVANVVDLSRLKVIFRVSEKQVFKLKEGDMVEIKTDVYPSVLYKGKIITIGAKADAVHTYPVEVTFDNMRAYGLRAGMFVTGVFLIENETTKMLVPASAVFGDVKSPFIFIFEDGEARFRQVAVGEAVGNKVEIRDGVKEGEKIIVNGLTYLKDGTKVTIQ